MSKTRLQGTIKVKEGEAGPKCNGKILSLNGPVLAWKKPC